MANAEFLIPANHLPEPICLLSSEGRIDACNEACGLLFGMSAGDLIGSRITDFIIESPETVARLLEACVGKTTWESCELSWRQHDGQAVKHHFFLRQMPSVPPDSRQTFLFRGESEAHSRDVDLASEATSVRQTGKNGATGNSLEYLAAIIDSSLDAVIGRDLDGRITCWTSGAERLFGYSAEEMLGKSLAPLIPQDRQHELDEILNLVRRGETVTQFETIRQAKDGRQIEVLISASPIRDGQGRIVGTSTIPRDITVLKEHEREIKRLSRLYAALSQINQAIVWLPDRDKLFQKICQVLVEFGGIRMAWIGWLDDATQQLMPVAQFGDGTAYISLIRVYADERPEGQGPGGRAFRTGQPYVCNDMLNDPVLLAWQSEIQRYGFQASAALPIRMNGTACGILGVYADQLDFFHDKELALMEEAALDVSFALDNLAREEARQRADIEVRQERDFSNAVLKSLPGILYLYDKNGRFLRWNQNFEDVSGYGADEISAMRPADFFSGPDKALIDTKIQEVFRLGESSVEAGFVSKDGRSTPYYLTGVATHIDGRECLIGIGIDISERKHAERLRIKSDARYRALFEHAPDGILILSHEGYFVDCNPAACHMFGYRHDELVGIHASRVASRETRALIDPTIDTFLNDVISSGEWHIGRKDGSVLLAEVIATTLPDGHLLALIRDVSERVRAEQQLREHALRLQQSEAHLIQAQQIAKLGSWELNLQNNQLHWSGQIYDIFEIDRSKFANTFESFFERVHPEDRDDLQRAQMAVISGESQLNFEHRIILPDGREKLVLEQADLKRDESGRPWKLSGIVLDISDRKRMELEREARQRAEAADRIKSAFLATMSHELRTPLNSIIGFTGIILQGLAGPLNDEQHKQLKMVQGSARHLLSLVNDVLDISKIEAGQLVIAREPFDPRSSIEKVAALVAPLAEKKSLQFSVDAALEIDFAVGDERRFEQILWNLLSNAMKFTEQGRVSVSAGLVSREDASCAIDERFALRVSVSDTGIGIKSEDLGNLFQPFRQLDTGLSRRHEGTGLGLTISRRLAELMGGDIRVDSVLGEGSVFHVTLPLRRSASK